MDSVQNRNSLTVIIVRNRLILKLFGISKTQYRFQRLNERRTNQDPISRFERDVDEDLTWQIVIG